MNYAIQILLSFLFLKNILDKGNPDQSKHRVLQEIHVNKSLIHMVFLHANT